MIITPTTKLDAVNEILSAVGEAPVDTLENTNNVDVMNAIRILQMVNREIQTKGWTFNTIENFILDTDMETQKVKWVDNILFIKDNEGRRLVNRDGYFYDLQGSSFVFTRPIEAYTVLEIPFEHLPPIFREYITARACRVFSSRYLGDQQLLEVLTQEEQQAYMGIMEYELEIERPSMLLNSDVQQLMKR